MNMPIMSELLIIGGLALGVWGSWKLYRTDSPRNEWLLSVLSGIAQRERVPVMAGERAASQAERPTSGADVEALRVTAQQWLRAGRDGWLLLLLGLFFQAMGTLLIVIPVWMRSAG